MTKLEQYSQSITMIGLPPRAVTILRKHGLQTVLDLTLLTEVKLRHLAGMGGKTVEDTLDKMDSLGYHLKEYETGRVQYAVDEWRQSATNYEELKRKYGELLDDNSKMRLEQRVLYERVEKMEEAVTAKKEQGELFLVSLEHSLTLYRNIL